MRLPSNISFSTHCILGSDFYLCLLFLSSPWIALITRTLPYHHHHHHHHLTSAFFYFLHANHISSPRLEVEVQALNFSISISLHQETNRGTYSWCCELTCIIFGTGLLKTFPIIHIIYTCFFLCLQTMFDFIRRSYYRYTVHTGISMLFTTERAVLHTILLVISYFFIKFTYEYVNKLQVADEL